MNKKYFFVDLDFTLLNSEKRISPKTYRAIEDFIKRGNELIICTGRCTPSLPQTRKTLELESLCRYAVTYNGSEIIDFSSGKAIYQTGLPIDLIKDIFSFADDFGIYCQTFTSTHIIATRSIDCTKRFRRQEPIPLILCNNLTDILKGPSPKILAIELHDPDKLEKFRQALGQKFGSQIQMTYSEASYLEIIPPDSGKGCGLRNFCRLMNIPIEQTIAAGDDENDISMIQAAGIGIAMINGKKSVLAAADIITSKDYDHDGLAEYFLSL